MLRLAFSDPLTFTPEDVYDAIEMTLSFKGLDHFFSHRCEMVLRERIELSTSPLPRECSTPELRQHTRQTNVVSKYFLSCHVTFNPHDENTTILFSIIK